MSLQNIVLGESDTQWDYYLPHRTPADSCDMLASLPLRPRDNIRFLADVFFIFLSYARPMPGPTPLGDRGGAADEEKVVC